MVEAPRVKFRCVHCNRLLSAPANRVGKAIACPKCVQAVTIPMLGAGSELDSSRPEQPNKPIQVAVGAGLSSGRGQETRDDLPDFMAAIPEEILAIQPEDIRAEIPLLGINLAPADRLGLAAGPPGSEEWASPVDLGTSPEEDARARADVRVESWLTRDEPSSDPGAVPEAASPSIEVETLPALSIASDLPVHRSGYLTLPASVVLAWSLFVLFAQVFAFLAGLFIGHYYWKHP